MARRLAVAAAVIAVLVGGAGAGPYAPDARTRHLTAAVEALAALGDGRAAFELELYEGARARCKAGVRPATIACAIAVAREACARRPALAGCLAATDVVITNQHAEYDLIDEATRIRLVRTSASFHAGVLAELRLRFAPLAAELALASPELGGGASVVAGAIDRFCTSREAPRCPPGKAACVPALPYQRCAAGLVWYIGGAP